MSDEIKMLKNAFQDAFKTKESLESVFYQELPGRSLDMNALGTNLEIIILNLIGKAEKEGWLMRLLDAAIKTVPNPDLEAAAKELKPLRELEEKDHYNVCFLSTTRVMVNRVDLRDALKQLEVFTPMGFRVLIVNGPPISGKTYSKELIAYLYEARRRFEPIWIDLDDYVASGVRPIDLAQAIIFEMGLDDNTILPAPDHEQDSRWGRNFCRRLAGKLRNSDTTWWIIIDGFNQIMLPQAVSDLIHDLASTSKKLPMLRMVLLSYQDELPDMAGYTLREEINPISQEDLVSFFLQLYEESKEDYDETKVARKVADVWCAVDPNDPRRVEKLGLEAARVAKSIVC